MHISTVLQPHLHPIRKLHSFKGTVQQFLFVCILMLAVVTTFQLLFLDIYICICCIQPYFDMFYTGQATIHTKCILPTKEESEGEGPPKQTTTESLEKHHKRRKVTSMGHGLIAFIVSKGFANKCRVLSNSI